MKVIVGLGNPGSQYAETRHNIGFLTIAAYTEKLNIRFRPKFQGLLAEAVVGKEKVFFFKPQTYMNLSGRAVQELAQFYKISSQEILVVHDDMDLALGKLRLRDKGSAGGHNGLKSLISDLGREDFWRLKIGINRPPANWESAHYVLSPFGATELPALEDVLERAGQVMTLWINGETAKAMNNYNC